MEGKRRRSALREEGKEDWRSEEGRLLGRRDEIGGLEELGGKEGGEVEQDIEGKGERIRGGDKEQQKLGWRQR